MRLLYHQDVQSDVNQALKRYESISPKLADALWHELQSHFRRIQSNPLTCHFETPPFRRVNLKRFPYAILYRVFDDHVKIMVVKHVKRRVDFGFKRR
ncbi:type II toxin-antitoxin system RelE/ParE family toxin [Coraliomargarita parva]|uniref:type II toxin-antitoxin system RelE/ParE family toxin n=1 Tax=Coraliomargarita parva TaxID=3014050 RepID=UPI0022B30874|nr:type II toxin-antitoxin system RelE/ParE family toxin [Coraliomargarita parva]